MNFNGIMQASILALACLTAVGSASAEIRNQAFRWTTTNPSGHPVVKGGVKFSELVAEKSGGKMIVKLYTGGVLGADPLVLSSLQSGSIDFGAMNTGILQSEVKEFALVDLPFLFNDAKEVDAVMDGATGKLLAGKLPAKGLINLAYYDLGFRNLTNSKRPVKKLEDLEGLKIRVIQSPTYIDTFTALGATAVPMAFTEVYTALEQKKIDGQENPFSVIAANKLDNVQKYLTVTRHIYNPQSFLMSKKTWERLNKEEQEIIVSAARESELYQRTVSRDAQERSLASIRKTMDYYELPVEEIARIRNRLKPVIQKYSDAIGKDVVGSVFAELEKLRK